MPHIGIPKANHQKFPLTEAPANVADVLPDVWYIGRLDEGPGYGIAFMIQSLWLAPGRYRIVTAWVSKLTPEAKAKLQAYWLTAWRGMPASDWIPEFYRPEKSKKCRLEYIADELMAMINREKQKQIEQAGRIALESEKK